MADSTDYPRPLSKPQILGQMVASTASRLGVAKLKVGGPILSELEVAAQMNVRTSQDVFNLLKSIDLANASGIALDRIGNSEQIPRFQPAPATGKITVTDTSFTKISSRIYHGTAAPIVGSVALNVEDATTFPPSGQVIIGRGTADLEGALAYSSKTNNGAYWTLNLSSPTTKFHNQGESVVLAQGGTRTISAGYLVATPQAALTSAVQFATIFDSEIHDGETEVINVAVLATVPGIQGNAPAGNVVEFPAGPPFTGATVTNPAPFIDGQDRETDNDYRQRIADVRASRQLGTDLAVTNSVLGVIATDENKRVTSAQLVRSKGKPATLYIDDGSGYEEITDGVGLETIIDSASGGESQFKTIYRPIAKAYVESQLVAPFALTDGAELVVTVGDVVYAHFFDASEFTSIGSASSYEVVASINRNPNIGFSARTADSGARVVLFARAETNDDLVVGTPTVSVDAADAFLFDRTHHYTTSLYQSDRLLSKDGELARIESNPFAQWNSFTGAQTLVIAVDSTAPQTYTFSDQDVIDANVGFLAVGKNDLDSWVVLLNGKIPGITAVVELDRIVLTSNRGRSAKASVRIVGGGLVTNLMFAVGTAVGADFDYSVDRSTGDIVLERGLTAGDTLTLGSKWTRAFIESATIAPVNVAADRALWFAVDADAVVVPQGVGSATPLTATVVGSTNFGFRIQVAADSMVGTFNNVQPGDWVVLYDVDTDLPDVLRHAFRVAEITVIDDLNNGLVLEKRAMSVPRGGFRAVALAPVGGNPSRVLAVGGFTYDTGVADDTNFYSRDGSALTASAEIWDPVTGSWTYTTPMATARKHHTASLLPDGRVLVAGGMDVTGAALNTTEIWDPATGLWSPGPAMAVARAWHTATTLSSGRILIVGGYTSVGVYANTSVEFNGASNTFINPATTAGAGRYGHSAVRLPVGAGGGSSSNFVMIAGGLASAKRADTEVYDPTAHTWAAKASMDAARCQFGLEVLDTTRYLIAVGDGDSEFNGYEQQHTYTVYDTNADTWSASANMPNDFYLEDGGLVKELTSGDVLALYGTQRPGSGEPTLGHERIVFAGGTPTIPTFSALPESSFGAFGLQKCGAQTVAITGIAGGNVVLGVGGSTVGNIDPDQRVGATTANHEQHDSAGNPEWTYPDPALALSAGTLQNRGIAVIRTGEFLQRVNIPAAVSYTAPTLVTAINAGLVGAEAVVYRTNQIRLRTNTFDLDGDFLLAATDLTEVPLSTDPVVNLLGHAASVESGASGLGTPVGFQTFSLLGASASSEPDSDVDVVIATPQLVQIPPAEGSIVGLRRWDDGINPAYWQSIVTTDQRVAEYGNTRKFAGTISAQVLTPALAPALDSARLSLRHGPNNGLDPHQLTYIASPHRFSPQDTLTVVIDQDNDTQRFVIPTYRRLQPANSTYGSQNPLVDLDAGSVTLGTTFGTDYDFNDYVLYMRARVKTNGADASKRILWRYARFGAEGNAVALRYMYPDAPNATPAVTIGYSQDSAESPYTGTTSDLDPVLMNLNIVLNSGAPRLASVIRPTSQIAVARTHGSVTAHVYDGYIIAGYSVVQGQRTSTGSSTGNRLRLKVPNNGTVAQGPQSTGITIGMTLWFEATNPSPTTLFSGQFTVTQVDAFDTGAGTQDIYFSGTSLNDGTTTYGPTSDVGTVSRDTAGEVSLDPAIQVGDYARLGSDFPADWSGQTFRVTAIGRQYALVRDPDTGFAGAETTPIWSQTNAPTGVQFFGGPTLTATALVAAINALAAGDTSTAPITGTVTGTGSGVVTLATWDEMSNLTAYYAMADGINYVQETVMPGSPATNTEFVFKLPITADLTTNSDWGNEELRIVPAMTANVVQWLNTPAVTGLWSVAEIAASSDGTRVQIASNTIGSEGSVQVLGGTGNTSTGAVVGATRDISKGQLPDAAVATIPRGSATGFTGDTWVRIDNATGLPKAPTWVLTDHITSISANGQWSTSWQPYDLPVTLDLARVQVEKVGDYIALHFPSELNTTPLVASTFQPGDIVYLCPAATVPATDPNLPVIASANQGAFPILRSCDNKWGLTVWIENPNAVEQLALGQVKVLSADSPRAGDLWAVSTNRFGSGNRRTWTITSVGSATATSEQYVNNSIWVDVTETPVQPLAVSTAFGSDVASVQVRQGVPFVGVKHLVTIAPNTDDGAFMDLQFDDVYGGGNISAAGGSVITALDKLSFPADLFLGRDGYKHDVGLIGAANRVVYGDPSDEATYPGVAAAGATVNISGPTVKRIQVSLALRVQSGLASQDLADRVRSSVASAINQSPLGEPIAISALVDAAMLVGGVRAVSVIKPTYSSTSDIIPVQSFEKALVLNIRDDINITFVGV